MNRTIKFLLILVLMLTGCYGDTDGEGGFSTNKNVSLIDAYVGYNFSDGPKKQDSVEKGSTVDLFLFIEDKNDDIKEIVSTKINGKRIRDISVIDYDDESMIKTALLEVAPDISKCQIEEIVFINDYNDYLNVNLKIKSFNVELYDYCITYERVVNVYGSGGYSTTFWKDQFFNHGQQITIYDHPNEIEGYSFFGWRLGSRPFDVEDRIFHPGEKVTIDYSCSLIGLFIAE